MGLRAGISLLCMHINRTNTPPQDRVLMSLIRTADREQGVSLFTLCTCHALQCVKMGVLLVAHV